MCAPEGNQRQRPPRRRVGRAPRVVAAAASLWSWGASIGHGSACVWGVGIAHYTRRRNRGAAALRCRHGSGPSGRRRQHGATSRAPRAACCCKSSWHCLPQTSVDGQGQLGQRCRDRRGAAAWHCAHPGGGHTVHAGVAVSSERSISPLTAVMDAGRARCSVRGDSPARAASETEPLAAPARSNLRGSRGCQAMQCRSLAWPF